MTIPAELRRRYGFLVGDEVDVVEDGDALLIVRDTPGRSRGERVISRMRGQATTTCTTDELMVVFWGE